MIAGTPLGMNDFVFVLLEFGGRIALFLIFFAFASMIKNTICPSKEKNFQKKNKLLSIKQQADSKEW